MAARASAANLGGFMAACATVEALWPSLACELGPHGIRLVIVRSAGSPDTPAIQEVTKLHAEVAGVTPDEYQPGLGSGTSLRRLPRLPKSRTPPPSSPPTGPAP